MYFRLELDNFNKANNDNNEPTFTNLSFPSSFERDGNFVKVNLESGHANSTSEISNFEIRIKNLNPLNQIKGGNKQTFNSSQLGTLSYNIKSASGKYYYLFNDALSLNSSHLLFNKYDWNINNLELEFINGETGEVATTISKFHLILGFETE